MSFGELMQAARQQAAALRALGLAPGDRVVMIIPEQRSFVVTFLAAAAARLVPGPVSLRLRWRSWIAGSRAWKRSSA